MPPTPLHPLPRWRQRLQSFDRALAVLTRALAVAAPSELERMGTVQAFEFTFELGWKTLQDYLRAQAVEANFPRDVIKEATRYGLLTDGETWLDMLEKRNLMAHTYDERNADLAGQLIGSRYYPALAQAHRHLMQLAA